MYTRHAVVDLVELGDLTLVAAGPALVGLYFPGHSPKPDWTMLGEEVDAESDPVLAEAAGQLRQYLRGERTTFDLVTATLVTATQGGAFDQRVWALLQAIPFGQTTTYGDLAELLGERALARRVGQAVGRNPLSIVVGCHRVVGKGGELRGYAGGLGRKRYLLDLEGRPGRLQFGARNGAQESSRFLAGRLYRGLPETVVSWTERSSGT